MYIKCVIFITKPAKHTSCVKTTLINQGYVPQVGHMTKQSIHLQEDTGQNMNENCVHLTQNVREIIGNT